MEIPLEQPTKIKFTIDGESFTVDLYDTLANLVTFDKRHRLKPTFEDFDEVAAMINARLEQAKATREQAMQFYEHVCACAVSCREQRKKKAKETANSLFSIA